LSVQDTKHVWLPRAQSDKSVKFTKVFSPVVKHTSPRVLLVMIAWFDLELKQLDVKMIFLYGELEEQIFMHQPEGFVVEGK